MGFEPTISAIESPQAHALERAATGSAVENIGICFICIYIYIYLFIYLFIFLVFHIQFVYSCCGPNEYICFLLLFLVLLRLLSFVTEINSGKTDNVSSSAPLSYAYFPLPPVACFRLEQTNLTTSELSSSAFLKFYCTPSIVPTKCTVLINTNITWASATCFGTCVPSSGRIQCQFLTLRWLMSYIYGAPILDVSRSHTTTQHSR